MAEQMPWEIYGSGAQAAPPAVENGPWMQYQSPHPTDRGALATGIQGFAQGITGNMADEIDASLTAGKRALVNGKDFGTEYNSKLAYDRQMQANDVAAHLIANLGGELAGGVALTPLLPSVEGATLAATAGKSALQGAGMGAAYGFGGANGDIGDRLSNAAKGAVIGVVTGAAVPLVVAGGSRLINGATAQITSAGIKDMAQSAYQKADELGGMLSPKATNTFLADASSNLKPQTMAGSIVLGETEASKLADRLSALADKPISLQAAQEIDSGLGDLVSKEYGIKGLSADGKKILDMQTAFRKTIEEATPENGGILGNKDGFDAWKVGKDLWSKQAKLRDIESIVNRANLSEQPANAIRSGFKSLASNPTRMRGYDANTQALIRQAAKTGIVGEGLRLAGSRLTSIGSTVAGSAVGGPLGATVAGVGSYLTGMAARKAGEALAQGKANKVVQSIAGDLTPAVQQAPEILSRGATSAANAAENASPQPTFTVRSTIDPTIQSTGPIVQEMAPSAASAPVPTTAPSVIHNLLQKEEGSSPFAKPDTTGHQTVGTGFNLDQPNAKLIWAKAGVTQDFDAVYSGKEALTPENEAKLFQTTSQAAQKAISKIVPNYASLGENQKAALTSLAFQLGGEELSKFKALKYLNEGNAKAVENSLLGTLMAKQTPARTRREALMLAYNTSHEDADRQLAASGRIQPNQRKYL